MYKSVIIKELRKIAHFIFAEDYAYQYDPEHKTKPSGGGWNKTEKGWQKGKKENDLKTDSKTTDFSKAVLSKNIKLKIKEDEENESIEIKATDNDEEVGSLTISRIVEPYEYEFSDVMDEDTFNNLYPDADEIVKIQNIEVNNDYKGQGIATALMKKGMKKMLKDGYKHFYLNASPMGQDGLPLDKLVNFYKKFGFKEILNQGPNVLMGAVFE